MASQEFQVELSRGVRAPMKAEEWLEHFASMLGVSPRGPEEIAVLLELAGVAAHASQRTAAPISCWLAAQSGEAPADALAHAQRLASASMLEDGGP